MYGGKNVKILSIAIPCYNSAAYMRRCIDSLLSGGEDVEILIVDDGSTKDNTAEIADEYEKNYPGIVKAIHQENGGHGEAVNAGLRNATGVYYKVVDSDDWVDVDVYLDIIKTLKELVAGPQTVDMFISNFVYDKAGAKHKKVMRYKAFPENEVFQWDHAKILKCLLMIVTAPVILVLTLFVWLCMGLIYISGLVFGLLSTIIALLGVAVLITYSPQNGVQFCWLWHF